MKKLLMLVLIGTMTCLCFTSAKAQPAPLDLTQMMGQSAQQKQITFNVACGDLKKSNCAQVLPLIAGFMPDQYTINPAVSTGSVQSAEAICLGLVQGAIGQLDAVSEVGESTSCAHKIDFIGQALYPYYGYLVVANTNPANSLDDMVNNVPEGKTVNIADGKNGSGGQITFENMLNSNTNYKRVISEVSESQDAALAAILAGNLDGYFVMDSPGSPLVAFIQGQTDKKGNPLFKFLDVEPGSDFYGMKDLNGNPLYQQVTISSSWFSSKNTVSTNAMFFVNNDWDQTSDGTQAVTDLDTALSKAESRILAVTLTPSDWSPTSQASGN